MATTVRTVDEIKTTLNEAQAAETELAVFTNTSQTGLFNKFKYVVAFCANICEQIFDGFRSDIESQIALAAVGSDAWIRAKMLELQYSATTPQVMTLNNYAPSYATIDESLRIISRCSVKTTANKTVNVKVATGEPPAALSVLQLAAAQGYLSNTGSSSTNGKGIGFAGVQHNVTSLSPDRLYVVGKIKYDGQYASTIQTTVIAAINEYLANLEFDGIYRISRMIDYIQAVPGVIDVELNNVGIRASTTAYPGFTYLITGNLTNLIELPFTAGYAIEEDTIGSTFTDTITYLAV